MEKHISFETGYQGELSDRARLNTFKRIGFAGVFYMYDGSVELTQRVEYTKEIGLKVDMLHLPFKGINDIWLPGQAGEDYVDQLIEGVRFAARYGVRNVVCHLSSTIDPPAPCPLGLERLGRLHREATGLGVTLCMENTRFNEYLQYFFGNYPLADQIGFCFDFGHTNCFSHDSTDPHWSRYLKQLTCVHMHDNDGTRDQHAMPFEGNLDWNYLMPTVFGKHPEVPMTLEFINTTRHDKGMPEEEFIRQAMSKLVWLESLI